MDDNQPTLREQLVEARAKITRQLEVLDVETRAGGRYPFIPDVHSVRAELEEELREIDRLLGTDEEEHS